MIYINLKKSAFTPEKMKKYNETAVQEFGEEESGNEMLIIDDSIEANVEEVEDKITVSAEIPDIGYVSLDFSFDTDELLTLIEIAVKKMNKFKTVLEGLK